MGICDFFKGLIATLLRVIKEHVTFISVVSGIILGIYACVNTLQNILFVILYFIGLILIMFGILAYVSYIAENDEEKQWKSIYFMVILLALLLCPLIIVKNIKISELQALLTIYITTDLALLAVILAAITINPKNIITRFIKDKSVDLTRFKEFILLIPFTIFVAIFVCIICVLIEPEKSFFPIQGMGVNFNIYSVNVLLWVLTLLTFLLILNTMYYTQKIIEIIIKDP